MELIEVKVAMFVNSVTHVSRLKIGILVPVQKRRFTVLLHKYTCIAWEKNDELVHKYMRHVRKE